VHGELLEPAQAVERVRRYVQQLAPDQHQLLELVQRPEHAGRQHALQEQLVGAVDRQPNSALGLHGREVRAVHGQRPDPALYGRLGRVVVVRRPRTRFGRDTAVEFGDRRGAHRGHQK